MLDLFVSRLVHMAVAVGVVGGLLLMAAGRSARRAYRRRVDREAGPPADQCRCGYPLGQLAVPRCPECGRVVGFDATAEDLGLSDEQLRRAQAAKDRRRTGG